MTAGGPLVIVVAEPVIDEWLVTSDAVWQVQDRQPTIGHMWDSLSGGRLSPQSSLLVFSDSLEQDGPGAETERAATVQAIAAMARAGARVFIAVWDWPGVDGLRGAVDDAARAQGVDPGTVHIHYLDATRGREEFMADLAALTGPVVEWPVRTEPVSTEAPAPRITATADRADIPTLGIGESSRTQVPAGAPSGASPELLAKPPLPGQVTITVTSSKGGSGKSTAALLLAATIARSSADAGEPLSVCIVDMDTRDGQVASLIGTYMPTALNIRVQPVWDETTIRRHLVYEENLGIHALLAPIRPRTADTVGPEFYRTIIRSLQRMFDVVVMDTSVQYLDPLISKVCLPEATEILFITTLASTAVQGMARALREITAPIDESGLGISRDKIGIIVNQSVAGVGMHREQVLAAGLGVPVVGVIPLATRDVLTATNLHRMHTLLEHELIGPAYNELARACLPGRNLASPPVAAPQPAAVVEPTAPEVDAEPAGASRRKGLFRRD